MHYVWYLCLLTWCIYPLEISSRLSCKSFSSRPINQLGDITNCSLYFLNGIASKNSTAENDLNTKVHTKQLSDSKLIVQNQSELNLQIRCNVDNVIMGKQILLPVVKIVMSYLVRRSNHFNENLGKCFACTNVTIKEYKDVINDSIDRLEIPECIIRKKFNLNVVCNVKVHNSKKHQTLFHLRNLKMPDKFSKHKQCIEENCRSLGCIMLKNLIFFNIIDTFLESQQLKNAMCCKMQLIDLETVLFSYSEMLRNITYIFSFNGVTAKESLLSSVIATHKHLAENNETSKINLAALVKCTNIVNELQYVLVSRQQPENKKYNEFQKCFSMSVPIFLNETSVNRYQLVLIFELNTCRLSDATLRQRCCLMISTIIKTSLLYWNTNDLFNTNILNTSISYTKLITRCLTAALEKKGAFVVISINHVPTSNNKLILKNITCCVFLPTDIYLVHSKRLLKYSANSLSTRNGHVTEQISSPHENIILSRHKRQAPSVSAVCTYVLSSATFGQYNAHYVYYDIQ